MAISDEQRAFRAGRLGSSDALRLMAGSWRALWEEKTGRAAPPALDFVACVQIGIVTEPLHARFYTHQSGIACQPGGDTLVHPKFDFIVANIDFLTWRRSEDVGRQRCDTLIEAKFSTGFKSDGELAAQYYWQVQHQLLVSGLEHAVLSILRPASYSTVAIGRDDRDIAKLLDTLHAFWWYVENDIEPEDIEAVAPPAPPGERIFDMSRHNEFVACAAALAENRPGLLAYRDAEAAAKALMPAEAQIAFVPPAAGEGKLAPARAGVVLQRSKDGKLALRFGALPARHRRRAVLWGNEDLPPAEPVGGNDESGVGRDVASVW